MISRTFQGSVVGVAISTLPLILNIRSKILGVNLSASLDGVAAGTGQVVLSTNQDPSFTINDWNGHLASLNLIAIAGGADSGVVFVPFSKGVFAQQIYLHITASGAGSTLASRGILLLDQ